VYKLDKIKYETMRFKLDVTIEKLKLKVGYMDIWPISSYDL
jgi:hypothetical protein